VTQVLFHTYLMNVMQLLKLFFQLEKPSKCSKNCSANKALVGNSHIMITFKPFSPRFLKKVRDEMGLTNIQIMIPFVRTVSEAKRVIELLIRYITACTTETEHWVFFFRLV
jgi:hypothetical protein